MKTSLSKVCTNLNKMLNEDGYNSKIDRVDFIVIDFSFLKMSYLDHYYIKVQDKKILLFTTIETGIILQESASVQELAFALSTVACDYAKDGIDLTIKEGTLIISSLIRITFFTSPGSLYKKVINRLDYCTLAYGSLLDMLNIKHIW